MRRRSFLAFALCAILVLFVGVNAIAGVALRGARVDLTADRIYSMSSSVDAVLGDLNEPVNLTLYFSRGLAQDYPQIRSYGARVRELLQALVDRSGGKLRLEIVDPEPFSVAEDRAISAGVRGAPTQDGDTLYFGLEARNMLDERLIVPFFNPEREPYLEYEVVRLIADLGHDGGVKVALLTSLPLETLVSGAGGVQVPQPIYIYQQLLASFDLTVLDRDFEVIPTDTDVLMIAHPWELDPVQLYAVDQFVLATGRALVLVDPYSRLSQAPGPTGFADPDAVRTSDLEPLLAAWGVAYDPQQMVLDRANARIAGVQEEGRFVEREYPAWFAISQDGLAQSDLVTAALVRGVGFASAGALTPAEGASTAFSPIMTTSDESRLMDLQDAVDASPRELLEGYTPEGAFTVAARISGRAVTAYPDGAPDGEGDEAERQHLTEGDVQIIIVSDSDVLDDTFYVQRDPLFGDTTHADNAVFVLNALDILAGSDALVSLRSRARADRPMSRIDAMRARAEDAYYAEQDLLQRELEIAEARLAELEGGLGSSALGRDAEADMAEEAQLELSHMRDVVLTTRASLRRIERSFRADIERLEAIVIIINVWLLPLLVAALGVVMFIVRRRAVGAAL